MLHLFGVQIYVTQTTETFNTHRTRLIVSSSVLQCPPVSSSVDHLHVQAEILMVREHSELLSTQYLARCLDPENVCCYITTRETPKRRMKEILFTRHRNTVEPMMLAVNRKATLQAIHTDAVNKAVNDHKKIIVLDDLPHPINDSEKYITRKERATLAQKILIL